MTTQQGIPCPTCSGKTKGETEYVALVKNEVTGEEPHRYAVCAGCFRKQFEVVNPGVKCPI